MFFLDLLSKNFFYSQKPHIINDELEKKINDTFCICKDLILQSRDYKKTLRTMDLFFSQFVQEKSYPYDRFRDIRTYNNSVSETYKIDYINASFVNILDREYIAFQDPKEEFLGLFEELVNRASVTYIISLKSNPSYLKLDSIKKNIKNSSNGIVERYTMTLSKGKEVNLLVFPSWEDYKAITKEEIDELSNITDQLEESIKPGDKILVNCAAGVGRTGTFIMYKSLRAYVSRYGNSRITTDTFLKILFYLRFQRNCLVQSPEQLQFLYECFVEDL